MLTRHMCQSSFRDVNLTGTTFVLDFFTVPSIGMEALIGLWMKVHDSPILDIINKI
jgi:hypothetical protein